MSAINTEVKVETIVNGNEQTETEAPNIDTSTLPQWLDITTGAILSVSSLEINQCFSC